MTFNFHAKYGLFTYAQCGDLDAFQVVCRFSELGAECIVGREKHEDGGTHLHVFAAWETKFRTRRADKFDVGGCHPNVVPSRGSPEKGYDYAIKDGDVVAGGLERPDGGEFSKTRDVWAEIINGESREEFWRLAAELAPRSLACNFSSLRAFADWKYRVDPEPYIHPEGISFDTQRVPELSEWVSNNLGGHSRGGKLPLRSAVHILGVCRGTAPTRHPIGDPAAWVNALTIILIGIQND